MAASKTATSATRKRTPRKAADALLAAATEKYGADKVAAYMAAPTQAQSFAAIGEPGKWGRDITRYHIEHGGKVSQDPSLWVRDDVARRETLAEILRRRGVKVAAQ